MQVKIEDLLLLVSKYDICNIDKIKKAYDYAADKHAHQLRESGEPYIIHPLSVAKILAELNADADTICAGLLHDVIEDTDATKDEIVAEFGESVAKLVMGVTNLTKMSFYDKKTIDNANLRKLILGMTKDVRIIIIKLADRLHNMMTLQYKKNLLKQQAKSIETMEIYVPMAQYLGLDNIKTELEDRSFMYLKPDNYKEILEKRNKMEKSTNLLKEEVILKIQKILNQENLEPNIKFRLKGIYSLFKCFLRYENVDDIHDLLSFIIILDNIDECYLSLRYIHENFKHIPKHLKDYIGQPKPNHYQALHTTVVGPDDKLIQMQLKTYIMDQMSQYGITVFWHEDIKNGTKIMQESLKTHYPILKTILEANKMANNNQEFVNLLKGELSEKIEVLTANGKIIEIAEGATPIDFAYKIHSEIGNNMAAAIVNGHYVDFNHKLKSGDRVRIITDNNASGPTEEWLLWSSTERAHKKIKEFLNKKKKGILIRERKEIND